MFSGTSVFSQGESQAMWGVIVEFCMERQGKNPAWFSPGREMRAQQCLSGLEHGRNPAWLRAGREMRAQEYLSGLEQGQDPAWFKAGSQMWAQTCSSGA